MFVGICQFQIHLPELKSSSRRSTLQRIKSKVFERFKIMLAEVGDSLEAVELGFALVSRDKAWVEEMQHKVLDFIETSEGLRIEGSSQEILDYGNL